MTSSRETNLSSNINLHPRVGVGVIVEKNGKILLGERIGSHGANTWSPPGGHLEFREDVIECAKRELLEETGLLATFCALGPWTENVLDNETKHYISLFVIVDQFEGTLHLMEPEKCISWKWFSWEELPSPLFAPLASFITLQNKVPHFLVSTPSETV